MRRVISSRKEFVRSRPAVHYRLMVSFALVLVLLLFASTIADAVLYSSTATFQLQSFANSKFAPYYNGTGQTDENGHALGALHWSLLLPQEGLTNYYVVLSDSPYTIDTGGTITISLNGAGKTTANVGDDANSEEEGPQFALETYLDYVRSFVLAPSASAAESLSELWNREQEFFFLNQPRFHCLLNAPYIASYLANNHNNTDTTVSNTSECNLTGSDFNASEVVGTVVDDVYMLQEAVLEVKVFHWDIWYRLTETVRLQNSSRRPVSEEERNRRVLDTIETRSQPYNLHIDPAKVCSAPALYTVGLNNLIAGLTEAGAPSSIVIEHAGLPQRIVAVLVQCSAVPVTVRIDVEFLNPHQVSASLETYFTAVIYFVVMSAYALLFVVYLTLIISCKRRRDSSAGAAAAGAGVGRSEKEAAAAGDAATVGSSDAPSATRSRSGHRHDDRKIARRERDDDKSSSSSDGDARRAHRSRKEDVNSPGHDARRRDKRAPHRDRDDRRDRDGRYRDDVDGDDSRRRRRRDRDGCDCIGSPNLFTRLGHFVKTFYRTHTIIVMADGRMQWMVFVAIPVKCLICIFFAASFAVLNTGGLNVISQVNSLPFVSRALDVAVGTILFALELLVAVGWGLAFKGLTTAQIVVLAIGCILFFVFDVCVVSTCPVDGRLNAFTANAYARQNAPANCIAFQYISYAISFMYHMYNLIQLFLVTRLLGHRAVRDNRDVLLNSKRYAVTDLRTTTTSHRSAASLSHASTRRDEKDSSDRSRDARRRKRSRRGRHTALSSSSPSRRRAHASRRRRRGQDDEKGRRKPAGDARGDEAMTRTGSASSLVSLDDIRVDGTRSVQETLVAAHVDDLHSDPDALHSFGSSSSSSDPSEKGHARNNNSTNNNTNTKTVAAQRKAEAESTEKEKEAAKKKRKERQSTLSRKALDAREKGRGRTRQAGLFRPSSSDSRSDTTAASTRTRTSSRGTHSNSESLYSSLSDTNSFTLSTTSSSTISSSLSDSDDVDWSARRRHRSSRPQDRSESRLVRRDRHKTLHHVSAPVAAEGGLFPVDPVIAVSEATRHSVETMNLFLRYHGMRYPFLFLVIWQLLFLALAFILYEPEHYYMKVLFDEIESIYLLCFIILFLRKEPFYC